MFDHSSEMDFPILTITVFFCMKFFGHPFNICNFSFSNLSTSGKQMHRISVFVWLLPHYFAIFCSLSLSYYTLPSEHFFVRLSEVSMLACKARSICAVYILQCSVARYCDMTHISICKLSYIAEKCWSLLQGLFDGFYESLRKRCNDLIVTWIVWPNLSV